MLSPDMPHRELGIVGKNRTNPNKNRIVCGAQGMGHLRRCVPADQKGLAARMSNAAIDSLGIAERNKRPPSLLTVLGGRLKGE